MTIYGSLMAKAAEWEHDDYHRIPLDDGKHAYACSLDCRKCQLEALAKQVCETAKRTVTANSEEHGALMISSLYVNAEVIGGPK